MYIEGVDSIDNKIIHLLRNNARMSYSAIGEVVGLSRVAVKNRIDALEKNGIIQNYRAIINPCKSTEGLQFTLDVEVQEECLPNIVDVLCKCKYIRQVYRTNRKARLHCQGYAPSEKALHIYVHNLFDNHTGILKLEWQMIRKTYKDEDGGVEYEGSKKDI